MEKPAYILSFLMGYPQHRDYYLYHTKTRGWVWPVFLLALAGAFETVCLFCRYKGLAEFSPPACLLAVSCAVVAVAAWTGNKLRIWRRSRRWYRQKQFGKRKSQIRFYEDFFTVHYPARAFDGLYREVYKIDRTRRLVILVLKNGATIPIPGEVYSQELAAFLAGKLPELKDSDLKENTEKEESDQLVRTEG